MKLQNTSIAALLLLATCAEGTEPESTPTVESAKRELGKVPASEVAVWQKVGSSNSPDGRYLQAAAYDEARKVVVMFGGITTYPSSGASSLSQDTWEWSPATGEWTKRTLDAAKPDPRSGAAMVYDSARAKFILFGGRAGSGFNLEDTWEWDPTTGAWTDVGATGHPSARSQHAMVYEKSTGKVLLFGGGRSTPSSSDGSGVSISLGDTWEYDPATNAWASLTATSSPSVRNDSALVWDSGRNKAVLFGGIQTDIASATGVPKQDTWEWDPRAGTWTERTSTGSKPSQRYGHAMAFDGTRKKVVLFGGWDMSTGLAKSDLWDWDPTTGIWTQRLTGAETGLPTGRMYASMVADDARDRMIAIGGALVSGLVGPTGAGGSMISADAAVVRLDMAFAPSPSREIWELDPVTPAFSDKTPPLDVPTARYSQAMAYNPATGKTCVFGGSDTYSGQILGDYWEWDGQTWAQPPMGALPPARASAAMAFDPARKSMILFGGVGDYATNASAFADTWELTSAGKWVQLNPVNSPDGLMGAGMVTDTTRKKILLFGGSIIPDYSQPIFNYDDIVRNEIWEWDGATLTWTNRTPPETSNVAHHQQNPSIAYDEGRQKLFLYEALNYGGSLSSFLEWDPVTGGWATRDTGDMLDYGGGYPLVAYDSVRRREVLLSGAYSTTGQEETWELDTVGPTWYVRSLPVSPANQYGASMVFDSNRGVVVYFGGQGAISTNGAAAETWEYRVTGWGNGEGCTAASASQCASGYCVDGVCCEVAACTGACKSCGVPGSEGTCVLAKAGTEVAGSCAAGKACDGTGNCKSTSSSPCTSGAECASGFCSDGACCDSACTGPCVACNQAGRAGQCTPYQAGTDPQNECGQGTGACKSTCDGAGNCAFPQYSVSCGNCLTCDGYGSCSNYDYKCSYGLPDAGPPFVPDAAPYPGVDARPDAGAGGGFGTGQGGVIGLVDGGPRSSGGSGGTRSDASAGAPGSDAAAGNTPRSDGSAGSIPGFGGNGGAGNIPGFGGNGGAVVVGLGGSGGSVPSGAGGNFGVSGSDSGPADAAVNTNLHKGGCNCDVAKSGAGTRGFKAWALAAALALVLVRKRRRQS